MRPGVWLTSFNVSALPDVLRIYADRVQYLYLESPTRMLLTAGHVTDTPLQDAIAWAHQGRAFGSALEVRWRRVDMLLVEAQVLWEEGHAPADITAQQIVWTASEWNARLDPDSRPRAVILADRPESVLRCLDYLCDGIVFLTRLCDIVPLQTWRALHS